MNCIIDKGDPEQEHKLKQKRFWSFIKPLRKDSCGIAPLKENGRLHAEPNDKADILNRQYVSTWTKEDKSSIPSPNRTPFWSMPEIEVINKGMVKLLLKLNPNKVSKGAKIRNRYKQVPHLTQETNGKVTKSVTREPRGQPFPSR